MNKLYGVAIGVFIAAASAIASELPLFVGACSSSNGAPLYRIVSDPSAGDLYFSSILNQMNIDAAQKSGKVSVLADRYEFTLFRPSGEARRAVFLRKDAVLVIANSPEDQRLLGSQQSFDCKQLAKSEHQSILSTLKKGWERGKAEIRRDAQMERSRPNAF